MSQSYVNECIFCQMKRRISDEKGKCRPYIQDGTEYDCKSKSKNGNGDGNDISVEILLRILSQLA